MRIPDFARAALLSILKRRVEQRRQPDFVIVANDPADPHLLRWWVIPKNRWFNIYYHVVLRSDDDRALHDHPWRNLSVVLDGGYHEEVPVDDSDEAARERRTVILWRQPGAVIMRRPRASHRLVAPSAHTHLCIRTLFFTGPKVRDWGFWCPKGWRPWQDFIAKHHSGSIGRGCED